MTFTTSGGGPFSYLAWLPQDYGDRPCWGARLIINYNYGSERSHSLDWVWDRKTIAGPEHLREAFWSKVSPLIDKAHEILSLPENGRWIETQDPQDRAFRLITADEDLGVAVYYLCAHGYCYLSAVETDPH